MAQIQKLIQENQKLKYQLEKLKSSNGLLPYIDDSVIKGGYHVVKNISERDSIDCCHRKLGMKVLVIGEDLSFKEYVLKSSSCKENIWEEVDVTVEEDDVTLVEDYSELEENLTTQKELNLVLKQLILNLQTNLDNKLEKGIYTGTAQDLKNSIDSKANISHTHDISSITNLQNSLDNKENISNKQNNLNVDATNTKYPTVTAVNDGLATKQKVLSSFDESILIETDGNIEGNVSLFTEYFQQQVCELNFIPIQIIGVYQDGIKLLPEEFNITLPKTITITTYSTEKIEIQYTHLKNS